jgi:hypothetical protein
MSILPIRACQALTYSLGTFVHTECMEFHERFGTLITLKKNHERVLEMLMTHEHFHCVNTVRINFIQILMDRI